MGVILALQASCGVHLGVDNLNVVRHVGRMLDDNLGTRPFQVIPDGDLLCLVHQMLLYGDWTQSRSLKLKVMRVKIWLLMVVFGIWIV